MPTPPDVPPAWREVLDHIDRALAESLARLAEPAQAPAAPSAGVPLDGLDARLAALQERLDRVGQDAARAEANLGAELAVLERWLVAEGRAVTCITRVMLRPPPPPLW
jgi:hypothetical protein